MPSHTLPSFCVSKLQESFLPKGETPTPWAQNNSSQPPAGQRQSPAPYAGFVIPIEAGMQNACKQPAIGFQYTNSFRRVPSKSSQSISIMEQRTRSNCSDSISNRSLLFRTKCSMQRFSSFAKAVAYATAFAPSSPQKQAALPASQAPVNSRLRRSPNPELFDLLHRL